MTALHQAALVCCNNDYPEKSRFYKPTFLSLCYLGFTSVDVLKAAQLVICSSVGIPLHSILYCCITSAEQKSHNFGLCMKWAASKFYFCTVHFEKFDSISSYFRKFPKFRSIYYRLIRMRHNYTMAQHTQQKSKTYLHSTMSHVAMYLHFSDKEIKYPLV